MKTRTHIPLNDIPGWKGVQWPPLLVKQAVPGCEIL